MLRDKVLVQPETAVKISEVIVMIEDTTALPPARGTVLAVGPSVQEVQPGETVHFERFDWCTAPGDCIIISEGEILAKEI